MAVDTKAVTGRRTLRFDTIDEMLADVERLNQGPVKALGNWSPGQVLKHQTIIMVGSLDGFKHRATALAPAVRQAHQGENAEVADVGRLQATGKGI